MKIVVLLAALLLPVTVQAESPYLYSGVPRMIVFGDSYSSVNTALGYWKWSTQLYYETYQVATLIDRAVGGSTGGSYGSPTNDTFAAQVSRFLPTTMAGANDLTVIYFGANDMTRSVLQKNYPGLPKALGDYHAALNRLIAAGFASGDRHILLVMGHDWSKVPRFWTGDQRAKHTAVHNNMLAWNAGLAAIAAQHPNVVAADVFEPFECVFRHPSWFGYTDVSHELTNRSLAAKFLYNYKDRYHFGYRGQYFIRQVIAYYLTAGWDWSNATKDPTQAKATIRAELAAGHVFAGLSCVS